MTIILESTELEIPETITYSQAIDFNIKERKFFFANKEGRVQDAEAAITEAVSILVKGDLSEIPYDIDNDEDSEYLEKGGFYSINIGDEISILRLYAHLLTEINSHQTTLPTTLVKFDFEYKGDRYFISPERSERLLLARLLSSCEKEIDPVKTMKRIASAKKYKIGEVLEVKENRRQLREHIYRLGDPDSKLRHQISILREDIKAREKEELTDEEKLYRNSKDIDKINELEAQIYNIGDPDGINEFTISLNTLAIIARKNKEKLPVNEQERQTFILERAAHFQDLPLSVVNDVTFFLTCIYERSKADLLLLFFSKADPTSTTKELGEKGTK